MILMIVFPYLFSITSSSSLAAAMALVQVCYLSFKYRKYISLKIVLIPTIVYTVFTVLAIMTISRINVDFLRVIFGSFLCIISAYYLFAENAIHVNPTNVSAVVCSSFSGIFSGLFSVGGPPLALYMLSITDNKEIYMGNLQFIMVCSGIVSVISRYINGLYPQGMLPLILVGATSVVLGMITGVAATKKMDFKRLKKIIYSCVGLCGLHQLLNVLIWGTAIVPNAKVY